MNYKFDGSRVFHMNETIIANWNSVVGPDDIIFHLGDFCLGGSAEWINVLNRLNGKIYLIAGNHDIKNLRQNYTKYFESQAELYVVLQYASASLSVQSTSYNSA